MVQAESNTATGLTVVPKVTVHQVKWALQRKLRHLEVPCSKFPLDWSRGWVERAPRSAPKVWMAEAYRRGGRTVAVRLCVRMIRAASMERTAVAVEVAKSLHTIRTKRLAGPSSRRQSGAMPSSTVATTPSASAPKVFFRSSPRPPT